MRPPPRDHRAALVTFLVAFLIVLLIRTAWLGDDAYITFRTLDNFVAGYGLRWNVAERVQAFTHPLWLFVLSVPYYFSREAYFTSLAMTMALSVAAFALIVGPIAASAATAIVAGATLLFSKSFVDYSTSGLENPLTHLLIVLLLLSASSVKQDGWGLVRCWLLGGLLLLNRLDLGFLVLPLLVAASWKFRWRPALRAAAIGLMPVASWELFSVVYYGVPFPNTAYAKLHTGIPAGALIEQGGLYLIDAFSRDPVTPLMIAAIAGMFATRRLRTQWPVLLGALSYLAYIVSVGGDFMAGRFLTAPLVFLVAAWARDEETIPGEFVPAMLGAIVMLGTFATERPPLTSGRMTFVPDSSREAMSDSGIADERAYYYRYTGLLRYSRDVPLPWNYSVERGLNLRHEGPAVIPVQNVGFIGYYAGPTVTLVDEFALADAFLARLPADGDWRVGHYHRTPPAGYIESIKSGRNQIADTKLAMLYERVRSVTQDPLWSRKRWRAIVALNGVYQAR